MYNILSNIMWLLFIKILNNQIKQLTFQKIHDNIKSIQTIYNKGDVFMKKIIVIFGLLMMLNTNLFAQTINVNGITSNVETKNIKGRTFVKLRDVTTILGCDILYDENTKMITVTKADAGEKLKNVKITYEIGNIDYEYRYSEVIERFDDKILGRGMDVAPQIINGFTYLPIRYVADPLGYDISMSQNKEIILEKRA